MKHVPLGEIVELVYGRPLPSRTRTDGSIPVYGSNGISGSHNEALTTQATIVVGRKGAYAGAVHYEPRPCWVIDTAYYVRALQNNVVNFEFLVLAMRHLNLVRLQTATGIPGLNREDVYRQSIPLPPLDEQRRIVDILDHAASIRRLREQAQAKVREIIPALFVDMFGDPATNPKGYDIAELDNVSDIKSGLTKGRKLNGGDIISLPYLRVANVQDGRLDLSGIKHIDVMRDEVDKFLLRRGDLVMTEGGDPDKLGRSAIWRGEVETCVHQNHICRVRLLPKFVLSDYICALSCSGYGKGYFL